jgi:sirohydrochlorin cobaltochelatase
MSVSLEDVLALETLETKIRAILPASYGESYEDLLPVSMGSAPLKYDLEGKVAWNQIWATFCELAMAGGPPHRGTLLQPASEEDVAEAPGKYEDVVGEICRGISLVTPLRTHASAMPGWIEAECHSRGMAAWLVRAIVMENVMARHEGKMLYLPAGPEFQVAREIKNVITSMAKTCHYWCEHMTPEQQQSLEEILGESHEGADLLEPCSRNGAASDAYRHVLEQVRLEIGQGLGLPCFAHRYYGWAGIECPNVRTAVWIMRAMVVDNVLVRREGESVFLPIDGVFAADGRCARLIQSFTQAYHLSRVKKLSP